MYADQTPTRKLDMNRPVLIAIRFVSLTTWFLMCAGAPAQFVLVVCWTSNLTMLGAVLAGFLVDYRQGKPLRWVYALAMLMFYVISLIACPVLMAAAPSSRA